MRTNVTTLRKYYTREFSLLTCMSWDRANRFGLADWVSWLGRGVKTILFLRSPASPKVTVWYDPHDFERFHADVHQSILTDPAYFRRAAAAYRERWTPLVAYADGTSPMKTREDFQNAHRILTHWWSAMPVMYVTAGFEDVPEAVLREARELRTQEERYADRIDQMFTDFVRRATPQLAPLAEVMTPDEVMTALNAGLSDEQRAAIEKRRNGYGMLNGEILTLDTLDPALARASLALEEDRVTGPSDILKGQGVSPGQARGRVRRIRGRADVATLRDGEVLVTEMTHPEYVPAMRKAAAIVTDEGGITSHAAIVSRELRIPCVIGTRLATQLIADGDLVEVDAEKGVVRIVKRATA